MHRLSSDSEYSVCILFERDHHCSYLILASSRSASITYLTINMYRDVNDCNIVFHTISFTLRILASRSSFDHRIAPTADFVRLNRPFSSV